MTDSQTRAALAACNAPGFPLILSGAVVGLDHIPPFVAHPPLALADLDVGVKSGAFALLAPECWVCGQPSYHPERREWLLYCYDASERPKVGLREREWHAVAPTEVEVVREMVRCLGEIAAGRVPK